MDVPNNGMTGDVPPFARWQAILRSHPGWDAGNASKSMRAIDGCLSRVVARERNPQQVVWSVSGVAKGYSLLRAAYFWPRAAVGGSRVEPERQPTDIQLARGAQWRLVMAWGGFETLAIALLRTGASRRGLSPPELRELLGCCVGPPPHPVSPPPGGAVRSRLAVEAQVQASFFEAFTILRSDQRVLCDWFEGKDAEGWVAIVRLARAMRAHIAHGALSATWSEEWGLVPVFDAATESLWLAADRILETLCQP